MVHFAAQPDFGLLYAYLWVGAGALVLLVGVAMWSWDSAAQTSLFAPLNQQKDWRFTDSFASKISLSAGIVVTVFANKDVVATLFGTSTNRLLPVFAVTAGISAALIAAAPVVLAIFAKGAQNRLLGILLAALLTITGTGGQLAVLTIDGATFGRGGIGTLIAVGGIAAAVILVLYAVKALVSVIEDSQNAETGPHTRATIL